MDFLDQLASQVVAKLTTTPQAASAPNEAFANVVASKVLNVIGGPSQQGGGQSASRVAPFLASASRPVTASAPPVAASLQQPMMASAPHPAMAASLQRPMAASLQHPGMAASVQRPMAASLQHPGMAASVQQPMAASLQHPGMAASAQQPMMASAPHPGMAASVHPGMAASAQQSMAASHGTPEFIASKVAAHLQSKPTLASKDIDIDKLTQLVSDKMKAAEPNIPEKEVDLSQEEATNKN